MKSAGLLCGVMKITSGCEKCTEARGSRGMSLQEIF